MLVLHHHHLGYSDDIVNNSEQKWLPGPQPESTNDRPMSAIYKLILTITMIQLKLMHCEMVENGLQSFPG